MKEEDDPEGLDLRDDESLRSESVRSMASSMAVTGRNFPDRESMHAIERARDASNIGMIAILVFYIFSNTDSMDY